LVALGETELSKRPEERSFESIEKVLVIGGILVLAMQTITCGHGEIDHSLWQPRTALC
jgi:hypothetical protein